MSVERIRAAAEDLRAALAGYDPESMRQVVRELPILGEALVAVSAGLRAVADRSETEWPAGTAVTEGLRSMANDVRHAAGTAGVAQDTAQAHHQADIERHDAPRGGRAAESRWDVTRTDDGPAPASTGRHRVPDQREEQPTVAPHIHDRAGGAQRGGGYDPDQPRAADGKWTKDDRDGDDQAEVPDVLGVAGTAKHNEIIGSDQVPGQGKVPANVMLADWDQPGWEPGGKYVVLETPEPQERDPSGAPMSPAEAGEFADQLDDLAGKAERGVRPPKPSKYARATTRIEDDIKAGRAKPTDKLWWGDGDDELPLTNKDLLDLLRKADPEGTKDNGTRTHVVCKAAADAGSDEYATWAQITPDGRVSSA